MAPSRKRRRTSADPPAASLDRLVRPVSLVTQVEQLLRQALAERRWPSGRLPTEIELAEQLGVSRETVRLAAEALQRDGLVVKIRRRGTFTYSAGTLQLEPAVPLLGYLQMDYRTAQGQEEVANRTISGLMLQGAIEEAGKAGFKVVVQHASFTQLRQVFDTLHQHTPVQGVILASYAEEKVVRRVLGLGLPVVLLDHDIHLARVNTVRDDSFAEAQRSVAYLASLGHRRIALVHWQKADLNPWRLRGYRQGLVSAGLPRHRRWEILTELTEKGAREAVGRWLSLSPRPTALYCFNNTMARLVIEEILRLGLRVPEDASVMGAGGEEMAGLTCQQVDWHQLGRTAVAVLRRALEQGSRYAPEHHLMPHRLCVGRTTAPPPS
jgi:DNA-binding LacI/PurR family transcriptional regulator/biotin operon repressor